MAPFSFLQEFEQYLKTEKRYAVHTLNAYMNDVEQFVVFASCNSLDDLKNIKSARIRSWMVSLIDDKVTGRSVNRKLSALRTFYKWMMKEGLIEVNPMQKIRGPKIEKRLPAFAKESELKTDELEFLFDDSLDGLRDKLLIELLYQTGIRLNELINLKDSDVQNQTIKVLGKRNKERIIPISDELNQLISRYQQGKQLAEQKDVWLLMLKNGKKLYPKFVYRKINTYLGVVTNLDKRSPHVLRHTFATHMLNNGAGLETLKELLGHANLSATQVYTHNSFSKLSTIYSQAHPRGHKN